jgi:hypothetical protein
MSNVLKMLSRGGAVSAETDPNFKQTVLLLHGDGTNGAQNNTFLDGSTNNFTITRNGNTTQGTFSPFSVGAGEWSNFFDGNGDYLGNTSTALITQNVSTFTVEGWIYMTAYTINTSSSTNFANKVVAFVTLDGEPAGIINYLCFGPDQSGVLYLRWFDGAGKVCYGSTTLALNTWYHIACVVNAGSIQMYVNGVAESMNGTTTLTNRSGTIGNFAIGANNYAKQTGYSSNIRVTTSAVYTTGFTPSTSPLSDITNTILLTCQSNRFVDNSSSPKTITRNGDVKVTPFSPFAPSAAYSASTNGGSGYFDGTGDYLSLPNNSAFSFDANFTVEFWLYTSNGTTRQDPIGNYGSASTGWGVAVNVTNARDVVFYFGNTTVAQSSGSAWTTNSWNHIAVVRSSTTVTIYVNGISVATGTLSGTASSGNNLFVGATGTLTAGTPQLLITGYLSNVRVVKGTAVYTAAFTPPTAPLTAVTNTNLLCNFTNAGIFDNTGKNVLETVGNAQIDTTTKKFGTGSMEFDGTADYLVPRSLTELAFGTGDFTIEFWLYLRSTLEQWFVAWTGPGTCTIYYNQGTIRWFADGAVRITGSSLSTSTWYHIALVRSSGSTKLYINGTQTGSTYTDTNSYVPTAYAIGATTAGVASLDGFIDDLRITKGVARYTANFTAPTKAFPDL